jgi:hypothetical protein
VSLGQAIACFGPTKRCGGQLSVFIDEDHTQPARKYLQTIWLNPLGLQVTKQGGGMKTWRILLLGIGTVVLSLAWYPMTLFLEGGNWGCGNGPMLDSVQQLALNVIGDQYRIYAGLILGLTLLTGAIIGQKQPALLLLLPFLVMAWTEHLDELGVSEKLWIAADVAALVCVLFLQSVKIKFLSRLVSILVISFSVNALKAAELVLVSYSNAANYLATIPIKFDTVVVNVILLWMGIFTGLFFIWLLVADMLSRNCFYSTSKAAATLPQEIS